ncbi:MAG TPA: AAA family ATPase [Noviherbaspirillum sp.]|nr:AAA family ATPase [Noviherbaspirillum sp.]
MKIVLTSSYPSRLRELASLIEAGPHALIAQDGAGARLAAAIEQHQPELLVVEAGGREEEALRDIEAINLRHPGLAVILLCSDATPELLVQAMRSGVREVFAYPVQAAVLDAGIARVAAKLATGSTRASAQVLAFLPCKGGSGATFLATNLGYQLAKRKSVLLVDLNLQMGDALTFVHDEPPASTLAHVAREIRRLDATLLAASTVRVAPNYSILAAPEDPSQAFEIKPEHVGAVLDVALGQYDFVLLDLGRSIDPVSMKALDYAHRIYPVFQAGLPYLRNARKMLAALAALDYRADRIEPIVNRYDRRGEIGLDAITRLMPGLRLHTVPNAYKQVSASINQGTPLVETARTSTVSRRLTEFTHQISPSHDEGRGVFGRLFGRA